MTVRILHFADLHLGIETHGRIDPSTGMSTRLADFLASFDHLVDFAIDNDIDLVLFCGDAYKSRDPNQTYQREFARRVRKLSANNIPVFLVAGNHDLPNATGRATAVEIFQTLQIENVAVANQPQTQRINTRKGFVQIVALPWVRRSSLMGRPDCKDLSFNDLNKKMEDVLTAWLGEQIQALDTSLPAILAGHMTINTATIGSEGSMTMGRDYVLLQSNIANRAFDYVALGHIHKRQATEYPVPVVYSGSLQAIDFGDEDQEKGFYVVELDEAASAGNRLRSYEFKQVPARRFVTINVDACAGDPTQAVLSAIAARDVRDSVVRVHIKMSSATLGLLQENEIKKALKDAYCIAAINKDVERENRRRLGGGSVEGLTPVEALRAYLASKRDMPEDRARVLLEYGERLILQEAELRET